MARSRAKAMTAAGEREVSVVSVVSVVRVMSVVSMVRVMRVMMTPTKHWIRT